MARAAAGFSFSISSGSNFLLLTGMPLVRSILPCKRALPQVRMQAAENVGFSSGLRTDLPLYEPAKATFDQYMSNKQRVFQAIFPDKERSEKLNDEEWRIHMLPIQFLFLTAYPVIDMNVIVKAPDKGYPQGISKTVPKVLIFECKRWDLRGLGYVLKPSDFWLGVRGALYSEKVEGRSRLKAQMDINVSFVLPSPLAVIPRDILKTVGNAVLIRLLENMKERVNERILTDYRAYAMEQSKTNQIWSKGQAIEPAL